MVAPPLVFVTRSISRRLMRKVKRQSLHLTRQTKKNPDKGTARRPNPNPRELRPCAAWLCVCSTSHPTSISFP